MSDPNVSLTRTYCTDIARRVLQGRVLCRVLGISGYTPTRIGTGSGHSPSIARGPRSSIWQGETMLSATKVDAEVRFASPARCEGSEGAATQGNGPQIAALDRNVPSVEPDDQRRRYCMQLLRKQHPWVSRYPHGVAGELVGVCDPGASRWYNIWYRGEGV